MRGHTKLTRYQNDLLDIFRELALGMTWSSKEADTELVCKTFDKFNNKKKGNSGAGSELTMTLQEQFLKGLKNELSRSSTSGAADNHYTMDYKMVLWKAVQSLLADIYLEILLCMGYSLKYSLPLAEKPYSIQGLIPSKEIGDIREEVTPAKHKKSGLAAKDEGKDEIETTSEYLNKCGSVIKCLLKHYSITNCFDTQILVSVDYNNTEMQALLLLT